MKPVLVIYPYKHEGVWVFDDQQVGLVREPFVMGASEIIDRMVENIPNAEQGFSLFFSDEPFPGHQIEFDWRREEDGGNWYDSSALGMEGWLCPALLKYFDRAPETIYAQCTPKTA